MQVGKCDTIPLHKRIESLRRSCWNKHTVDVVEQSNNLARYITHMDHAMVGIQANMRSWRFPETLIVNQRLKAGLSVYLCVVALLYPGTQRLGEILVDRLMHTDYQFC